MVRLTAFCASVIGLVVVVDVFMAVSAVVPAVVFLVVSAVVSVGVSAITVLAFRLSPLATSIIPY